MKHFPNPRPPRLAGLEECIEHLHRRPPSWRLYGRLLAMMVIAGAVGILLTVVLYKVTEALAP